LKFLFLNQTFYPDVASSGQHLAEVAVGLAARGHAVTVITGRRAYDDPRTAFAREEMWRGVHILRVGSTGLGKNTKWRRALDFASFIVLVCARLPWLDRHDVVVALTSPPLISLVGVWLARLHKSRFVYWVMDLNPDEAVAGRWLQPNSVTTKILERISRLSLRNADRVIALDRFMFERIVGKGILPERIFILPPWSHDPEVRLDPAGRARFRKQHGLVAKFVVMYSGNHSPCHPLDTVVEAARRLANEREIVFCFIGGGTEFRKIQRLITSTSIRPTKTRSGGLNALFLPYQPLSRLAGSLSAADLVLGNAFVGLVHPCKIYNILRVGAPVVYIGPRPSPISEILDQANGAMLSRSVCHGDVEGLIRQINQVRADARRGARLPHPLSSAFSKRTLLPRLIAKLESCRPVP
jgi:glycosyltransferase involved in cell wall biosynthesis